jgi:PAS domain S-box-containing protein
VFDATDAVAPPPASPPPGPAATEGARATGFDTVDAAVVITDTDLRIIEWNRAAEDLYGWGAEEAIGLSPCDLFVPPATRPFLADLVAGIARGESWSGNLIHRRADGSEFLARGTQSPLTDETGRVVAILSLMFTPLDGQYGSALAETHAVAAARTRSIRLLPQARRAFAGSVELPLTDSEFALLALLDAERGRVVDNDEISEAIWGHRTAGSRNFVQAHVSRLRRKLRDAGIDDLIETVRGVGYTIHA